MKNDVPTQLQAGIDPSQSVDMSVDLAGISLKNPLMTCSGTCGYADEYADYFDVASLGAFVTKSITVLPRKGNDPPRVAETRAGMLNSIGLANIGLDQFVAEKCPILQQLGMPVIVNVAGKTLEEYLTCTEKLSAVEVIDAFELNISCPNVKEGGMEFGCDPAQVRTVTEAVRKVCGDKKLIVKLTPNVTDVVAIATAAVDGGAHALSMINTLKGMAIDINARRPVLSTGAGGLSGPAVKPVAVYQVSQVYTRLARQTGTPIIGMGGIQTASDAIEFILAGATAVAVGTALFIDPSCPKAILSGMQQYCQRHSVGRLADLVGMAVV